MGSIKSAAVAPIVPCQLVFDYDPEYDVAVPREFASASVPKLKMEFTFV